MKIEILGTGCPNCKKLEANVREAVAKAGLSVQIDKVTEMEKILAFNIMALPALVLDGQVILSGRIADAEEIEKLIAQPK